MKHLKLKRLNMVGASHLIALLLVVVAVGIGGAYEIVKSHADSTQVSCYSIGSGKYNCGWVLPAPVILGTAHGSGYNRQDDSFYKSSTDWIRCQQRSSVVYHRGIYYNSVWAYTTGDNGTSGWVNATYGKGGANNGIFGGGVPNCYGKYGNPPTISAEHCVFDRFGLGSSGHCVKDIQNLLNVMNGMGGVAVPKVAVTGNFDAATARSVAATEKSCQVSHNDPHCYGNGTGVVGQHLWWYMCSYGWDNGFTGAPITAGNDAGCNYSTLY